MKWDKNYLRRTIRYYANIYDHIDTDDAAQRIKSAIWFRGPNVWILAFSIIIASVGLNVNSTAVVIGAMLISPLMGPIIGVGLALGTNDVDLLKEAFKNLVVMVLISLAASTLFFLLSPLDLVNPTELQARTSPTSTTSSSRCSAASRAFWKTAARSGGRSWRASPSPPP